MSAAYFSNLQKGDLLDPDLFFGFATWSSCLLWSASVSLWYLDEGISVWPHSSLSVLLSLIEKKAVISAFIWIWRNVKSFGLPVDPSFLELPSNVQFLYSTIRGLELWGIGIGTNPTCPIWPYHFLTKIQVLKCNHAWLSMHNESVHANMKHHQNYDNYILMLSYTCFWFQYHHLICDGYNLPFLHRMVFLESSTCAEHVHIASSPSYNVPPSQVQNISCSYLSVFFY